jgi:uncharacterized protein (DUF849 family)
VIRRLKACLNGGRMDPFVPKTPAELAESAVAAVAAGAEAVHLHPRGPDGRESLAPADVSAAVTAARRAGVPVGVTTGVWISPERHDLIAAWTDLPDFASVNVGEPGYDDLVTLLTSRGVQVEAGVWSPGEADRTGPVDRILVEIVDTPAAEAVSAADAILSRLDGGIPILLHGEDEACWPLVAHAGRLGLPTRIGLEDTLTGPAGEPVTSNADLVRLALEVWSSVRR